MNGATVCQTAAGQTICANVVGALPSERDNTGAFYTADFVSSARAMEGLVATATALSCLVALAFAFLLCTSPRILLQPASEVRRTVRSVFLQRILSPRHPAAIYNFYPLLLFPAYRAQRSRVVSLGSGTLEWCTHSLPPPPFSQGWGLWYLLLQRCECS